jgi:D-beta-D-heptose 7-phosphate kinase/D-beta-D-heptose 1-phosphate adenosyltransferase
MSRVLSLADLPHAAAEWRRDGAVVVLAVGCFDPLHAGHVQHLKAAKAEGNVLVVSVTGDEQVRAAKGPTRPRSPAVHRAEVMAALRFVDAAVVNDADNAVPVIAALRPHVFAKGREYVSRRTDAVVAESAAVRAYGGRVLYVSGDVICSSTAILAAGV